MTYLPLGHGLRQHFLGPQVKPGGQEPFVGTLSPHGGEVARDQDQTPGLAPDHPGGSRRRLDSLATQSGPGAAFAMAKSKP